MRALEPALIAAALLLLPLASALCYDPQLALFGTGVQQLSTPPGADGVYRANPNNTFNLTTTCMVTGEGASTSPDRWRAQLIYCGLDSCVDSQLPELSATKVVCGATVKPAPACVLPPTGKVTFSAASRDASTQYTAVFTTVVPEAWRGATTYYYLQCHYLCNGDPLKSQRRATASFTLDAPANRLSPPSPPPRPPPRPPSPPPARFYGAATAFINSALKDKISGVIYAPANNLVPVTAICKVDGQYALVSRENWPAQLLVCGNPPGSGSCRITDYTPTVKTLNPASVQYNGLTYTAVYNFNLTEAQLGGQRTTYRYFTCLYRDSVEEAPAKRAGASIDVIARSPPPPLPPSPPPPSPRPPSPSPPPSPRPPSPSPPPSPRPPSPSPPPSPRPPSPSPPPPRSPPPSPPPPTVPGVMAHGWGDPHFIGFDGVRFSYHGEPETWYTLLSSEEMDFKLKTKFMPGRVKGTTNMRSFELRNGTETAKIVLLDAKEGRSLEQRFNISIEGTPVTGRNATFGGGVRLRFVPPVRPWHGRVILDAGFMEVQVLQKWRSGPNQKYYGDFLDFTVTIRKPLVGNIKGLLGPSYMAAHGDSASGVTPAGAGGVASAAAAAAGTGQPAPAFLTASANVEDDV